MENKDLYKIGNSIADKYVKEYKYPYEVLPHIKDIILEISKNLSNDYEEISDGVYVSKSATISKEATIIGPAIIDDMASIRPNAYIRGNVIVGKNTVVGNSTEVKNAILYDNVEVPHFNYVGDSILGNFAHMGAGSITSNVKGDKSLVVIKNGGERIATNMKKVGAFLGDYVEIGCNSVLNPGTIIMPNTTVYPLTMVRGVLKENSIVKNMNNIVPKK